MALGRKLVYTDNVPLEWRQVTDQPTPGQLAAVHEENERVLRYIASLDDFQHEFSDEDLAGLGPGLARLEFKLNIVMDMMSQLLTSQLSLPGSRLIRLGSHDLCWRQPEDDRSGLPRPGDDIAIRVYICRQFPHPLVLHGTVVAPDDGEEDGVCCLHYDPLPDSVRELLEKMIFRQHRRLVSQRHQTLE